MSWVIIWVWLGEGHIAKMGYYVGMSGTWRRWVFRMGVVRGVGHG